MNHSIQELKEQHQILLKSLIYTYVVLIKFVYVQVKI